MLRIGYLRATHIETDPYLGIPVCCPVNNAAHRVALCHEATVNATSQRLKAEEAILMSQVAAQLHATFSVHQITRRCESIQEGKLGIPEKDPLECYLV